MWITKHLFGWLLLISYYLSQSEAARIKDVQWKPYNGKSLQVITPWIGYRRQRPQVKANADVDGAPTERPFTRVWNSFVRSVTPTFSFRNLTNPFTNIFNGDTSNVIETPPLVEFEVFDEAASQELQTPPKTTKRKRKSQAKRKQKRQRTKRPSYEWQDNEEEVDDDNYYNYNENYNNNNNDDTRDYYRLRVQPMFFYDANSGSYYGVQRFSPPAYQYNTFPSANDDSSSSNSNSNNNDDDNDEDDDNNSNHYDDGGAIPLGKINTRKFSVRRPIASGKPIKFHKYFEDDDSQQIDDDSAISEEGNAIANDESDGAGDDDIDAEPIANFSQDMRNSLGSYMRDDQISRHRQRIVARAGGRGRDSDDNAKAKITPRDRHQLFWLSAW